MAPPPPAETSYDIVIPTLGRRTLALLLDELAAGVGSPTDQGPALAPVRRSCVVRWATGRARQPPSG